MSARQLDFETIAARVDLAKLIEAEGIEVRRGKALCPFHPNENTPALSVYFKGDRWRYKCHSCGANGDAISWVAERENISPADAARKLGGIEDRPEKAAGRRKATPKPTAPEGSPASPPDAVREHQRPSALADPAWQETVDLIVTRAEDDLWSPEGADGLAYLRSRGLADHTIRRFRLGFVARGYETEALDSLRDKDGQSRPIYVARGIVLPWVAPGAWYTTIGRPLEIPRWVGANVRRLMPDVFSPMPPQRKCLALLGSQRGFAYPWAELLPSQAGPPALIVEGEFDALVAHQEAGDMVHVMTVGGSSQAPHPTALEALACCPTWLLALDHDAAGVQAALKWLDRSPGKGRRTLLPHGKDIGEFIQADGDLRAWLAEEIDLATKEKTRKSISPSNRGHGRRPIPHDDPTFENWPQPRKPPADFKPTHCFSCSRPIEAGDYHTAFDGDNPIAECWECNAKQGC